VSYVPTEGSLMLLYPLPSPYPCGCKPFELCLKHKLLADAQAAQIALQRAQGQRK
jgi:hypothetical protein